MMTEKTLAEDKDIVYWSFEDFQSFAITERPSWLRPQVERQEIILQIVDLIHFPGPKFETNPVSNPQNLHEIQDYDSDNVIRMYGVSPDGVPICTHVYGFLACFYASVPGSFNSKQCQELKDFLNTAFRNRYTAKSNAVTDVVFSDLKPTKSIRDGKLIKIYTHGQILVHLVAQLLNRDSNKVIPGYHFEIYEEEIGLLKRFLIEANLHGRSWIKFPSDKYYILASTMKLTKCQLEVLIYYKDIVRLDYKSDYNSRYAPLRTLGLDIECNSVEGKFPDPEYDPVLVIANIVRDDFGSEMKDCNIIFALKSSSKIENAQLFCFKSEKEMLQAWNFFVQLVDPDIFSGYNIIKFDFEYIYSRGCMFKIENFGNFGRNIEFPEREKAFKTFSLAGRLVMDLYPIIKIEFPLLKSYKLDNVAQHILNDGKIEIDVKNLGQMHDRSPHDRALINSYCIKDALLPLQLAHRLNILQKYTEIVKASSITLKHLLAQSTCIGLTSFCVGPLIKTARELLLVLRKNSLLDSKSNNACKSNTPSNSLHVLFNDPFLFAAIVMQFNICYTTIKENRDVSQSENEMYVKSPSGDFILNKSSGHGLLPKTLAKLSSQLKTAKTKVSYLTKGDKNIRISYCKISAIEKVIRSFPNMIISTFSPYSCQLIQRNAIAYYNVLNDEQKQLYMKKAFN